MAGMALLALGVLLFSRLDEESTAVAIGGCFLAIGAGFGAVMVTATAVIVRHAPVDHAGVAGGLQQTALSVGPALGVAMATMLMAAHDDGHHAGGPGGRRRGRGAVRRRASRARRWCRRPGTRRSRRPRGPSAAASGPGRAAARRAAMRM